MTVCHQALHVERVAYMGRRRGHFARGVQEGVLRLPQWIQPLETPTLLEVPGLPVEQVAQKRHQPSVSSVVSTSRRDAP